MLLLRSIALLCSVVLCSAVLCRAVQRSGVLGFHISPVYETSSNICGVWLEHFFAVSDFAHLG